MVGDAYPTRLVLFSHILNTQHRPVRNLLMPVLSYPKAFIGYPESITS